MTVSWSDLCPSVLLCLHPSFCSTVFLLPSFLLFFSFALLCLPLFLLSPIFFLHFLSTTPSSLHSHSLISSCMFTQNSSTTHLFCLCMLPIHFPPPSTLLLPFSSLPANLPTSYHFFLFFFYSSSHSQMCHFSLTSTTMVIQRTFLSTVVVQRTFLKLDSKCNEQL